MDQYEQLKAQIAAEETFIALDKHLAFC